LEYGILKETGLPVEKEEEKKEISLSGKEITVTIDGVEHTAVIK